MDKSIFVSVGIIAIFVFVAVSGFFQQVNNYELNEKVIELEKEVSEYEEVIRLKDSNISDLEYSLVVAIENKGYASSLLEKARVEKNDLQGVYDSLWSDALTCFWANYCLYNPVGCEEHFEDDWSAKENHLYYSDECDMLVRDWDKYFEMVSE